MAQNPHGNNEDEAIKAYKEGNMDVAIPLLRQAVSEQPESFKLRMYHGLALSRAERWQDAQREFDTAMELDGGSADAAFYCGVVIAKQGRLREAHGMFVVALHNNAEHAGALAAEEKTRGAAEQVTKEGSSAAMPGGLSGIDLAAIDLEVVTGGSGRPPAAASDPMASALADLAPGGGSGGRGAQPPKQAPPQTPGRNIKTTKKSSGCGSLVAMLGGLLVLGAGLASLLALLP